MARVKENPYLLKGKVGNQVFRVRNGKQYVYAASKKHKVSKSKGAVEGREKFAFFTKLGKVIADNYVLDRQWREIESGRTSNKIMKFYYHDVVNYDLANFNLVRTDDQFNASLAEVTVTVKCVKAVVSPLSAEEGISEIATPLVAAQGLIFLYNPAYKKKDKFLFIPLASPDIAFSAAQELIFNFRITYRQYKQINLYPVKNLLFNMVLKKSSGKPARFSKTVYSVL